MSDQIVFIASDHAGFPVKDSVAQIIKGIGFNIKDLGPSSEARVDYPDFANLVAQNLKENPVALGVLICGSGQGMAMRANKYSHIRAALCWNEESAKLSRQHNAANVLCLGARLLGTKEIEKIVKAFFEEKFEGGRHQARVDKISSST